MITEIKSVEPSEFLSAVQNEGEVELIVDDVSDIKRSKFNEGHYIYIDFKILSDVSCNDENLKGTIVGLAYSLKEDKATEGHFLISEKQKIFPLLKYAVNKNGHRIKSSFRCNEDDIKENLKGLEFKGAVKNQNNHQLLKPIWSSET